jgi:hypothetical protein
MESSDRVHRLRGFITHVDVLFESRDRRYRLDFVITVWSVTVESVKGTGEPFTFL